MFFQTDKMMGCVARQPNCFWTKARAAVFLILLMLSLGLPTGSLAATPSAQSPADGGIQPFQATVEVTRATKNTLVVIRGSDAIPSYMTKPYSAPPRLAIDFFTTTTPAEPKQIFFKNDLLTSAIVSAQPKKMRIMLHFTSDDLPAFTTFVKGNQLHIVLIRLLQEKKHKKVPKRYSILVPVLNKLLESDPNDNSEAGLLWRNGVTAYRNMQFSKTVRVLRKLIVKDIIGPYTERAAFLIARANERQFPDNKADHITEIRSSYENALARFPTSVFASDAMLSLGRLLIETHNRPEAAAYFNLVVKRTPGTFEAVEAALQSAKILRKKNKYARAMTLLNNLCNNYADSPQVVAAKIEKAKIYYDTNKFLASLNILSALIAADYDVISTHPEIALFLGKNYYQMGKYSKARDYLYRFFNAEPENPDQHLTLAQIADSYKDQAYYHDAAKIYNMVLKNYPKTEGALISMLRLASLQEQGLYMSEGAKRRKRSWEKKKSSHTAKAIYEQVIAELTESDPMNPLIQLAMLKLALSYQKENQFEQSLITLKDMMRLYPRTKLHQELHEGIKTALKAMLEAHIAANEYNQVLTLAQSEGGLIKLVDSPEIYLILARAATNANKTRLAARMYEKCNRLFVEDEKPPDLRFFMARAYIDQKKLKKALVQLDKLAAFKLSSSQKAVLFELKGHIFASQKRYLPAAKMFASALGYETDSCRQSGLLMDRAIALEAAGSIKASLAAAAEVIRKTGTCGPSTGMRLKQAGQMHLKYNLPKTAIEAFKKALNHIKIREDEIRIKFLMAKGYEAMEQKTDYLALYNEIAQLEDPFWSNLAREKLEEIKFKRDFQNQPIMNKG